MARRTHPITVFAWIAILLFMVGFVIPAIRALTGAPSPL